MRVFIYLGRSRNNLLFVWQRELRELCADRIHFYQALQESELKVQHSAAKQ